MGWRSLLISQPASLALQAGQLCLIPAQGAGVRLPLEDLSIIVLESPEVVVTTALLSALAEAGVAVLTCDASHHPNGALLPYQPHSRAPRVQARQLALTLPRKKRLWQGIVRQKLINQATCLAAVDPACAAFLRLQASRVSPGDPDNREATAASAYFVALFGPDFTRTQPRWTNAALNYGYAVLRAAIARSLVCHGFLPAFGVHHHSQLNAFNLADDLIEPLRPLIDQWVLAQPERNQPENPLTPMHKQALVQRLYADVGNQAGQSTALAAIDDMVQGLGRYCEHGQLADLDWPVLLRA